MNILFIITDLGSFNNFLFELSDAISKHADAELHVICSRDKVINIENKRELSQKNIHFHYVAIPRKVSIIKEITAAINIRKLVKKIKPDIIHAHFTTATFPTILFRNSGFKYWATFHGLGMNSSSGMKKIIFSIIESICFLRLDRIFTLNHQDTKLISRFFNDKVSKYQCLGVGCDINRFNNESIPETEVLELKKKYNIQDGQFVISFTGRFVSFKGFDLVIKSFQTLTQLHPNKFKLILMGGVDPIHATGLKNSETDFLDNCSDIINIGFTKNVEKYLRISNVFLFPSKKEGLPTCVLEALSMGVPVVTFNVRGNNDIVKHDYNGILIEPRADKDLEIKVILENLEQLVNDEKKLILLRENALKDRYKYSRDNFVNEHLTYYFCS